MVQIENLFWTYKRTRQIIANKSKHIYYNEISNKRGVAMMCKLEKCPKSNKHGDFNEGV